MDFEKALHEKERKEQRQALMLANQLFSYLARISATDEQKAEAIAAELHTTPAELFRAASAAVSVIESA